MYELILTYHSADKDIVGYDIFFSEEKIEVMDVHSKMVTAPSDAIICVGSLVEAHTEKIVWCEVFIMEGYFG